MINTESARPPTATAEERITRLQEALQRRFRAAGHGSIQRVQQALHLGEGYFKDQRRPDRRRIDLRVLFRALDELEVEPADFFADALGTVDPLTVFLSQAAGLRRKGRLPRILELERQRVGDETERAEPAELETLERASSRRVLRRAHALVQRLEAGQVPELLGIYASACQRLGRFDPAQMVVARALELAAELKTKSYPGLLQRAARVVSARGDHQGAVALSEKATLAYVTGGDLVNVGRTLVDQGTWFATQGRFRRAIRAFDSALGSYLSAAGEGTDVRRHRFSCLMNLGSCHLELGELDAARRYAALAREQSAGVGPAANGRLLWLQASIAGRRGQLQEAEEHLGEAAEIYRPVAPVESALASVERVRLQLLGGRTAEVYDTARTMTRLLEPLKDDRAASAAVAELLRCALTGRGLTIKLVDRVERGIRKGQGRGKRAVGAGRLRSCR